MTGLVLSGWFVICEKPAARHRSEGFESITSGRWHPQLLSRLCASRGPTSASVRAQPTAETRDQISQDQQCPPGEMTGKTTGGTVVVAGRGCSGNRERDDQAGCACRQRFGVGFYQGDTDKSQLDWKAEYAHTTGMQAFI